LTFYAKTSILELIKMDVQPLKSLVWIGSSKKDLKIFPDEVQDVMGYALYLAQIGSKHQDAKPLKGFSGSGVLEIVEDYDGDTYRAVYTTKFSDTVFVLHAFQKKSKHGIATPKQEMELIHQRLKAAREYLNQMSKTHGDTK
jgi:phage-related protein